MFCYNNAVLKYFSSTVNVLAYSANVPFIKIITPITAGKKRQQRVENAALSVHSMGERKIVITSLDSRV